MFGGTIAAGAGRHAAKKIDFRNKFEIIARANRACLHEILPRVSREAGAHEHVQDVVDVRLCLADGKAGLAGESTGEVGMAAVMILPAMAQEIVRVRSQRVPITS